MTVVVVTPEMMAARAATHAAVKAHYDIAMSKDPKNLSPQDVADLNSSLDEVTRCQTAESALWKATEGENGL